MASRFRSAKINWSELETPSVQRPKRPSTRANGAYGHPVHPALVTVPVGAWIAAFVFDLVSVRVAESESAAFAVGAYWLLVIGIVGAAAAAVFGGMDLHGVPRRTKAFRTGLSHLALVITATTAFVASLAMRDASPSAAASRGAIEMSAAGLVALLAGGFLGGRLAYHYGVRVADECTQAEGFVRRPDRRAS